MKCEKCREKYLQDRDLDLDPSSLEARADLDPTDTVTVTLRGQCRGCGVVQTLNRGNSEGFFSLGEFTTIIKRHEGIRWDKDEWFPVPLHCLVGVIPDLDQTVGVAET